MSKIIKYKGQFRVCCEWDRRNLTPNKEDTFIYCAGGGQIYRVNKNTLGYLKSKRGVFSSYQKKFDEVGAKILKQFKSEEDICFWFHEDDLSKVVEYLGARTSGVNISPYSKRNLRLFKWFKENEEYYKKKGLIRELTEEEKQIYRDRFNENITK